MFRVDVIDFQAIADVIGMHGRIIRERYVFSRYTAENQKVESWKLKKYLFGL